MLQGVHSFCEKGQRNLDWRRGCRVKALQAGVTYIFHFTYAFYATYCSQHSHRSSPSTASLLPYLPYHSSTSLDLAWLIFNIVSWFLSSFPLALLSCHLLYAVSLSCRDLWSATCHHPLSPRGASGWNWLYIYIYLWGGQGCLTVCLNAALNCGCCWKHLFIYTLAISYCVPLQLKWFLIESKRISVLQSVLNFG